MIGASIGSPPAIRLQKNEPVVTKLRIVFSKPKYI